MNLTGSGARCNLLTAAQGLHEAVPIPRSASEFCTGFNWEGAEEEARFPYPGKGQRAGGEPPGSQGF